MISLILMVNGDYVVSWAEELEFEPRGHLFRPQVIIPPKGRSKLKLARWPAYSDEEHILVHSDRVVTVCLPTKEIEELYRAESQITDELLEELTKQTNPVMLNESVAPTFEQEAEYEPNYQEIDE